MEDLVREALERTWKRSPKDRMDVFVIDFLKEIRDNGPDGAMKAKPHLFGGFYWGVIKAFLTYLIKRLEGL